MHKFCLPLRLQWPNSQAVWSVHLSPTNLQQVQKTVDPPQGAVTKHGKLAEANGLCRNGAVWLITHIMVLKVALDWKDSNPESAEDPG